MAIKIAGKQTASDFLILSLLDRLGGATYLRVPENLSPDQTTSLLNACMIDGMRAVLTGPVLCLTLTDEETPAEKEIEDLPVAEICDAA